MTTFKQHSSNNTMAIQRFCKRTMHAFVPCKIRDNAVAKYDAYGIKPWHHCLINGNRAFFYVWDTRLIEVVLPVDKIDQNDLTYKVIDNRMDIAVITNDAKYESVLAACEEAKYDLPIQFRTEPLTAGELELTDIAHV